MISFLDISDEEFKNDSSNIEKKNHKHNNNSIRTKYLRHGHVLINVNIRNLVWIISFSDCNQRQNGSSDSLPDSNSGLLIYVSILCILELFNFVKT